MQRGVLGLLLVTACSAKDVPEQATGDSTTAAPAVPLTTPGTFTLDDFRRLHWLDGRWQGFMSNGQKFYEQYRVENDSTIVMTSYPDSTFGTAEGTSRITLRNTQVTSESATSRYVATRLDSVGVDFAPDRGARNAFTWARETDTKWTATLRWTDKDGRPQTTVYALRRIDK